MRQYLLFILVLTFAIPLNAQVVVSDTDPSTFSKYYYQRKSHFESLPVTPNRPIVFLGNSITDGGEWTEMFEGLPVLNRGISGDVAAGVLFRIDEVALRKPSKVFLLIGVNDISKKIPVDTIFNRILRISSSLRQKSPATKLFIQSILPVNGKDFGRYDNLPEIYPNILLLNNKLAQAAAKYNYTFINIHKHFVKADGMLQNSYTNDGLHLNGKGYRLWASIIYPFIWGQAQIQNIIPTPVNITSGEGYFWLNEPIKIIAPVALEKEKKLIEQKWNVRENNDTGNHNRIVLKIDNLPGKKTGPESYSLSVTENEITIASPFPHGIFNGIQTLFQLAGKNNGIPVCVIYDEPAFTWRGFMTDVGRNYQSMDMLKKMIDVMAMYKLNVFHFHPTENVAWRIESKKYPQLHAPGNMLRNQGMHYTFDEIRELKKYCEDRYITFLPEIDMPGHSEAFTRAFGFDMQTDSGVAIVKELVNEFIDEVKPQYFHIGGDEVKVRNKTMIPEITKMIEDRGVKVMGWEPGANFTPGVIRQLWMDDNIFVNNPEHLKFIDSRHLYINHMDPLEAVTTLFFRKLGTTGKQTEDMLGAILCLWHDRIVRNEQDLLQMNPMYPSIITFAERAWAGGGYPGWAANIDDYGTNGKNEFAAFENKLLSHKKLYFNNKPFPYQEQQNLNWNLFGPYDNKGNTAALFDPEKSLINIKPSATATGGTIILRHWWNNLIKGLANQTKENSTWYASTTINAPEAGQYPFWIGFTNFSRSQNSNTPPLGEWNTNNARVWVNGEPIEPPKWRRAGQKGHSEIPLFDEGYEYRPPTMINLKKGNNEVLLKIPVGSFNGPDWHNPVKYQFTFVPVSEN